MLYPEYKHIELVLDKITNRNTVVKLKQVPGLVSKSSKRDCFRSYYRHPVGFSRYVRQNQSVAGWDGYVYSDYLWLDVDRSDLDDALETARYLMGRFETMYEIPRPTLRIYFSGAKGFHLGIDTRYFGLAPSKIFHTQFRSLAQKLTDDVKIDLGIFDKVRIFRLSGTINTKTGLFKIPLTYDELQKMSIDEIKTLAKAPRDDVEIDGEVDEDSLSYLVREIKEESPSLPVGDAPKIRKKNLHGTKICLWRMLQGVDEGMRDEAAIRLAADYQKKGMPGEIAIDMMKAWNLHNRPPISEEAIMIKIASAYGRRQYDFGCNDHILTSFCHEDCYLFKTKDVAEEPIPVYQLQDLEAPYKEYVKNAAKTKIQFRCMPKIQYKMRGLRPKEVAIIMARPGVGKSLVAQTMLHDVAITQGISSIFFSIEMPSEQIFERAASIETKWSTDAVEDKYFNDDHDDITERISNLRNIYIVEKGSLSIADIQETVESVEGIKFIVIDYMSLVRAPGNTIYERTSYVARQLKPLAKETGAAVLMISQVSRKGGDGTQPVTLEMGRDSGAIEEGGDFVMGMWCLDTDPDIRIVQLLKGRRGGAGTTDEMGLDGESVKFIPVLEDGE